LSVRLFRTRASQPWEKNHHWRRERHDARGSADYALLVWNQIPLEPDVTAEKPTPLEGNRSITKRHYNASCEPRLAKMTDCRISRPQPQSHIAAASVANVAHTICLKYSHLGECGCATRSAMNALSSVKSKSMATAPLSDPLLPRRLDEPNFGELVV
jgi:hypothetical protein